MPLQTRAIRRIFRLQLSKSADFLQNIGWLSTGLVVNRALRLAVTVVLARTFGPADYGLIALIFTAHEMISFFMQRCTNVKLIQAPAKELDEIASATYSINWVLGLLLFGIQAAVAWALVIFYESEALFLPLLVLGLVHLQLPFAMVHAALNFRAGKLKLVAKVDVAQTAVETLAVLALLMSDFGIWSVVIPKLVTSIVWVAVHRKHSQWQPPETFSLHRGRELLSYSGNLLIIDGLQVLRQNIDYLLIGYFLGIEALGLYFFAYNAGLGIATSFSHAINSALLPHLCESSEDAQELRARFRRSIIITMTIMGGLTLVQASMATFYVPMVFGQDWADRGAVPIIILLCLVALPKALIEGCSQYLRACDEPRRDLIVQAIFSFILVLAIFVSVIWGLVAVAVATLGVYVLFACWITCYCLLETYRKRVDESHFLVVSKSIGSAT